VRFRCFTLARLCDYIRRYLISHFREPVDIASTNFSEDAAVFGDERIFIRRSTTSGVNTARPLSA